MMGLTPESLSGLQGRSSQGSGLCPLLSPGSGERLWWLALPTLLSCAENAGWRVLLTRGAMVLLVLSVTHLLPGTALLWPEACLS